ncbi:uncharacterized protein Z518_00069 [Rhinocladiella mackenziei CBS 650.93]|uniref:Rhinocladiella mackenziei CBS 650.93 unplaced genomic scaffold supercont1.1, whole genome shotgun sequence n=1 Tax=Rhinocladiella mackenziei CBS 650.93 TaxID=1442369 RepID=A0A0D2J039_9EURO|nr:uncharacterized protein Z518_00069 [Rhinocladiella mackenziei CBS 650.93]KIX08991.1 hypothetical protein Z518_00069 [Rhinocladiella mackenziei CBS 650.93]
MRSSPPVLNKKTGLEYWESFPLDTVENIRKWQQDCAMHTQSQCSSFRQSTDDTLSDNAHVHHALHHSRPGSVDLSRHSHSHSQSGPFRSMSTDPYRSGTHTPVHVPQHAQSQSSAIPTSSRTRQQGTSQSQPPNWRNPSLFSSLSPTSGHNNTHTSNPNVGTGAEALLLQSFADSNWAPSPSLNSGIGSGMASGIAVESGPTEIDTGFFTNDMQRRLFW